MEKTDVKSLTNKFFLTDIRARLYRIALDLSDDPNYSREQAVQDIDVVCEILSDNTPNTVGDDFDNK